jgi:hypothetical protein
MTAARRAGSFGWEAIVEHCIALVAKSPLILRCPRWWHIMWQAEHEALRLMTGARWAKSFGWEAIEEHCIALVAKSPLILRQVRWWHIVWQHEHEALRLMTAARRAGSFGWEAIVEHCIALVAKSPLILLGHGYNLLQVTAGNQALRLFRSKLMPITAYFRIEVCTVARARLG